MGLLARLPQFSSTRSLIFRSARLSFFTWQWKHYKKVRGEAAESLIASHLPHSIGQSKSRGSTGFRDGNIDFITWWEKVICGHVLSTITSPQATIINMPRTLPPRTPKVPSHHGGGHEVPDLMVHIGSGSDEASRCKTVVAALLD